jgi:hypothetical protein
MKTKDKGSTREIIFRIFMAKAAFKEKIASLFHQQFGLKFKEGTIKVPHLEHSLLWC